MRLRRPDLGTVAVVVGAAAAALAAVRLPNDDIWWQVAYGRWILAHHGLPRTDIWSWTAAGHPVVVTEWAFDALMAAAAGTGGGAAAWLLALVCYVGAALAALGVLHGLGRNRPLAALLVLVWLVSFLPLGALLPQLASYGLLAAVWWVLEAARLRGPRRLLLLPPLFVVWANVHGSFFLGWILVALESALAWGPALPGRLSTRFRPATRRWLPLALLGSVAAALCNPYGPHLIAYEWRLTTDPIHNAHIAEFQSPNFHDPFLHWMVLPAILLGLAAVATTGRRRLPAREVLAALGLLGGALVMSRMLPYALLGLAAVAAAAARGRRVPVRSAPWWQLAVMLAALAGAVALRPPGIWPVRTGEPVAAVAYVDSHGLGARGFNTYEWGGYLLYGWDGRRQVYIDSRGDLYAQTPVLQRYVDMVDLKSDPGTVLRGENVAWALLPSGSSLAVVLSAEGWRPAYADPTATVLLPPAA